MKLEKKHVAGMCLALLAVLSMLLAWLGFSLSKEETLQVDAAQSYTTTISSKNSKEGLVDFDRGVDYIIAFDHMYGVTDVKIQKNSAGVWIEDTSSPFKLVTDGMSSIRFSNNYRLGETTYTDKRIVFTFSNLALGSDGEYHDVTIILSNFYFKINNTPAYNDYIAYWNNVCFGLCAFNMSGRGGNAYDVTVSVDGATDSDILFISFVDLDCAGFSGYSGSFASNSCIEAIQIKSGIFPGTSPVVSHDTCLRIVNGEQPAFYATREIDGDDQYKSGVSYLASATGTTFRWAGLGAGTAFGLMASNYPTFSINTKVRVESESSSITGSKTYDPYSEVDSRWSIPLMPISYSYTYTKNMLLNAQSLSSTDSWLFDFSEKTVGEPEIMTDTTFYIDINRARYTYSFDANLPSGKTISDVSNMPSNKTVVASYTDSGKSDAVVASPSLTGYLFTGWNTKADGTGTEYPGTETMKSDKVFYAQWEPSTYIVHFDGNGLQNPNHQTGEFTQNSVTGSMADQTMWFSTAATLNGNQFARTGYRFSGWNTKADGTGTSYVDRQSVIDLVGNNGLEITLYAQWEKQLGTGTITVTDEYSGSPISGVSLKLQKSVNGIWTDVSTGTTGNGGQITVNSLHWFNYQWVITGIPTGYRTAGSNTTFTINYDKLTAENTATLYRIGYKVRYDSNGNQEPNYQTGESKQNTVTGTMADSDYIYGVKGSLRSNAYQRAGYTFIGWNTKPDGSGTSYSDGYDNVLNWTTTDGDVITLYAQWAKKLGTETVTVVDEVTGNPVKDVSMKLQKSVNGTWTDVTTGTTNNNGQITVNDLHWFNYRWVMTGVPTGYRVSNADTSFTINYDKLTATNQVTVYRIWYKVRYDSNSSSNPDHQTGEFTQNTVTGTMTDSDYQYGVKGSLRANAYQRSGYTFIGWNTRPDGTGTSYPDKYGDVLNWTTADGGIVTLYAQWAKKLGTENITVVSEETGNPVKGVSMKLQKLVNGTWTNVSTGTTGTDGRIKVDNLHWFDYRWVMTDVPAGYVKSADTSFTIHHDRLSATNQMVLYMQRVTITVDSQVSDIITGENPPVFLYHISGLDAAGVRHEYNLLVQTEEKTKTGSNKVSGIFAGTYDITQIPVSRYNPGTAVNVSNATPDGTNASVDVLNHSSAEVLFPYTIQEYGWLSGTDSAVNRLRK